MTEKGNMIVEIDWVENGYFNMRAAKVVKSRQEVDKFIEIFIYMANPNSNPIWRAQLYEQAIAKVNSFNQSKNVIRNFRQMFMIDIDNCRIEARIKKN